MKEDVRRFGVELAVIGSGIAGFASSIFALNRGITTAQAGSTGAVAYTTGYLDLLGALEGSTAPVTDPWQDLAYLGRNQPGHPLMGIPGEDIFTAFTQFTSFLTQSGIGYTSPQQHNITALTPVGTTKQTLCVPQTMEPGTRALKKKEPCILFDFKGLKGFSGRQVVANLRREWPALSTKRISFPGMETGEIYPEVMARALEVPATREQLAGLLKDAAGDTRVIGLPALLGIHNPDTVRAEIERLSGLTVFEIPTMPPSVPGIRLREMLEQVFPQKGLCLIPQQKVTAIDFSGESVELGLQDNYGPIVITADAVILATGRFLSGGLEAAITGIKEPLIGLPVTQPPSRAEWYNESYTGPDGHAIHRAGIEVDSSFRPLGADGRPFDKRLFGAGVILAHQDWIRGRSGAGIAIATAFKAVEAAEKYLRS
jgi:glycerol-3-phosphate dehydrogenase subunit B